ncbi:MAG: N-acetylmuramoyl-L-alanine amidase [Ardenticatenaceae bacterium]|nr:N-acetylmuramoyl-L-alanine amidase [Ardenticatenaceae bacterium]MCB8973553.1 N-acetylmuramoyl-L-alanine amidase [Ardenticatenaceae bacterium]
MQSDFRDNGWENESFDWVRLLGRNLPIVIFLLLALVGMGITYWFFSPPEATAELIANSSSSSLSAPFYKPIPAKPVLQRLSQSPGPIRIGLVAGHKGSDSGAVCDDGLTEAEVNLNITEKVAGALLAQGIHADILEEFDPRLENYGGTAVVSIHADSCVYYNDQATGYKVAGSGRTDSAQLQSCMETAYQQATNLPYHANTITPHMTDYHAFRTLPEGVPAIIIETGFMNLDRTLLTTNADVSAAGILNGIQCFLDATQ